MKFLITICICLMPILGYGQEISYGLGFVGSASDLYRDSLKTKCGFEALIEYRPAKLGFAVSFVPNILFDNDQFIYYLPLEAKWIFGKKNRFYPLIGITFSSQSSIGNTIGLGYEREFIGKLRFGIKSKLITNLYYEGKDGRNIVDIPPMERIQFSFYLNKSI